MDKNASRPLSLLLLTAASLIGCDGGGGTPDDGGTLNDAGVRVIESVEAEIGPAGGTLELANKARLEVPAGALTTPVRLRMEDIEAADVEQAPDRTRSTGRTIALRPHGTTFEQPVRLRLETEETPNRTRVYRLEDETANRWRMVRNETKTPGRVEVRVSKFSVYAAFDLSAPDAGSECGALDEDEDGVNDFCDACDDGDDTEDDDADGIPNACDYCPLAGQTEGAFFGECSTGFYPSADTYVDNNFVDTNFGTSPVMRCGDYLSYLSYPHLRFDASSVPAGAAVSWAQLFVFFGGSPDGGDVTLWSQVGGWGELTSTWNLGPTAGVASLFAEPSLDVAARGYLDATGPTLISYVEASAGADANFTITCVSDGGVDLHTREALFPTDRPWLSVVHEPYSEMTFAAIEDAMVDPLSPTTNFGAAVSMPTGANGSVETDVRYAFLKFDLGTFTTGGAIVGAALEMNALGGEAYGSSGELVAAPVMDDTWSEASITYSNMPMADGASQISLWRISEPELGSHWRSDWSVDLAGLVGSYASDGVLTIRLEVADGWHDYASSEALIQALAPRLRVFRDNVPP